MFVYLLCTVLVLYLIHHFRKCYRHVSLIRKMPCPEEHFLIGHALSILLPPVQLFQVGRLFAEKFDGIYGWWALQLSSVNPYNPHDVETSISGSQHNEKSLVYKIIQPWLGDGLLLSNGAKWQHRRKILTPAFHFNILRKFFVIVDENSTRLVDKLSKNIGIPIDVVPVMSEYTLNSICETAMGTRLDEEGNKEAKSYKETVYKVAKLCVERFARVYLISDFLFNLSTTGRRTYKHLDKLHSFTRRVINERKEYIDAYGVPNLDGDDDEDFLNNKRKKIAMLDLLLMSEKEGQIDMKGIQEEVDTFMFEGHDTTASGLTFFLMLLANHKNIQDKIVAELKEIFGDSDCSATIDDLTKMRYLECCIKESLRLYPPVTFIGRKFNETEVLSGYEIPAGTQCHIHIFDLHRNPKLYENPLVFDPDRFLPENSVARHPYAYIPFSAGPRNCIGQKFAMMEMKSCISAVLRKYVLVPVTRPEDLDLMADLVLRNNGPVQVTFVERKVH